MTQPNTEAGGITRVIRFRTPDGKEWTSLERAKEQVAHCNAVKEANSMLEQGRSVGDCLRRMGALAVDPIMEAITKDSLLSIPHWQCKDEAGYKVRYFDDNGYPFVFGDVGSWSGPYGHEIPTADLARYARNENSNLAPAALAESRKEGR